MNQEIEIVDLINSPDHRVDSFRDYIAQRANSSLRDPLIANYLGLASDYLNYDAFHVAFKEDRILAFSGLWKGHFKDGLVRALTRTFYDTELRRANLKGHDLPGFATKYFLPLQVEIARSKGYRAVLVSMQGSRRRVYFEKIFSSVRGLRPAEQWEVPDGLYLTCPEAGFEPHPTCWQNIALLRLVDDFILTLPRKAE